ncbi:PKD domain-containing protein [Chitinophaga qingshengii]|uniref:PKD domain-containing protein n=1 Tax=Chitinophaga qingshengii TaxID=1569794 RepID=A0ABR7TJQ2_9BACT|nr:PKD domain-containing protein [Chitinophaga qingshengii]MBC9930198.1 PKD domain-containing protein [Chitinophaga qingshengii]
MAPRKPENEHKVNSFRPFGKIASHVDPMVLWTFFGLFLISAVLLAFQLDTREDCTTTDIVLSNKQHTSGKAYTVGEVITFNADNKDKDRKNFSWEFGDSSARQTGAQVYHAFNKPGSYMVTLVSGKCAWNKEIIIIAAPAGPVASHPDVFPIIDGPSEVFAGRAVTFTNKTPGAHSWTWRLLQDNAEAHSQSAVTYTFSSPGERTLSLIVNGDTAHMVLKRITVFPARPIVSDPVPDPGFQPPPPPPPVEPEKPKGPTAPAVADDEFLFMLSQVTTKQKSAGDFSKYLCDNLSARVLLNDKETDNFAHFCSRIYGKKKFKIEKVNLIKDANGCVKEIRIMYDRKKVLGIF